MHQHNKLVIEELTDEAFAEFGDVIDTSNKAFNKINWDYTKKFYDLADIDVADDGGRAAMHLFQTRPMGYPLEITMLEKHPKGSQSFLPLVGEKFFIVVAPKGDSINEEKIRCFLSNGRQGVNYAKGVWHHPALAWDKLTHFVVVDRYPSNDNLVEMELVVPKILCPPDAS